MKFLSFLALVSVLICASADPSFAGGDGSNIGYGTVADGAAGSSAGGGILLPLIVIAILAAAAASN